jgi:hypothetical protein
MKTILSLVLLCASSALGQTALTQTTLSAAINSTQNCFLVASRTGGCPPAGVEHAAARPICGPAGGYRLHCRREPCLSRRTCGRGAWARLGPRRGERPGPLATAQVAAAWFVVEYLMWSATVIGLVLLARGSPPRGTAELRWLRAAAPQAQVRPVTVRSDGCGSVALRRCCPWATHGSSCWTRMRQWSGAHRRARAASGATRAYFRRPRGARGAPPAPPDRLCPGGLPVQGSPPVMLAAHVHTRGAVLGPRATWRSFSCWARPRCRSWCSTPAW